MSSYVPPTPFHTFDPTRGDPLDLIPAIKSSMNGNHGDLIGIVGGNLGLPSLSEGVETPLDPATMLMLSLMDWQEGGRAPMPLDSGHSRERLGRFPSEDGNAIEYLLTYTKEGDGSLCLHRLLEKLGRGLHEESLGEPEFSTGAGGIELLGWIDEGEVPELRKEIERGAWSVASDEPNDGGVQDAFRHLLVILRSARRRGCGLLMRRHS
ncbi:MAG: hypothetical protein QGF28_04425 [Candidatus Thalassarchaeaceae archaeon]|nr:hypothetical protein [Candidatus Thalassarchaeaceae archaeon]MDP7257639.1 hypothetical protein [Candidatus Thalassarchaeaceae archaeon]MDP7446429.1 hypothetical protein [Candidatus Thalassarchaeaceae archaeon]MDP7649760.1 hypothetical protein [Candidatus Thalassarchaeaceae archaeon]HJL55102.1 hypothetical protein [Candidatus Thalassarchaeaceae archaeon]